MAESLGSDRFQALVLSCFSVAALMLAGLGVYGVLAYSVSLRMHEFGIRIALGSTKQALMRLVLQEASYPVLVGVTVGLLLAVGATSAIRSLLSQGPEPRGLFRDRNECWSLSLGRYRGGVRSSVSSLLFRSYKGFARTMKHTTKRRRSVPSTSLSCDCKAVFAPLAP